MLHTLFSLRTCDDFDSIVAIIFTPSILVINRFAVHVFENPFIRTDALGYIIVLLCLPKCNFIVYPVYHTYALAGRFCLSRWCSCRDNWIHRDDCFLYFTL